MSRLDYLRRIMPAYVLKKNSQITFWHEHPRVNLNAFRNGGSKIGEYYMTFYDKTNYPGPFDDNGVPLLNYHGRIGKQYNPIAIAQYGLGNYNLYKSTRQGTYHDKFIKMADWMADNIEKNSYGVHVWNHKFDWEYFQILRAPWYSALAQGAGVSLLVRAFDETKSSKYMDVANKAFQSLLKEISEGGVVFVDDEGRLWLEEYLVTPSSHVLNGFIWALWGVYDYLKVTKEAQADNLYKNCLKTLEANLHKYDFGYWSLYDLSENRMRTMASPFYHTLHIVQLDVLYRLTGSKTFLEYFEKWNRYRNKRMNVAKAVCYKSVFKLLYY